MTGFSGSWSRARSVLQDTASAIERFELRQAGRRITGRFVRTIEGPSPDLMGLVVEVKRDQEVRGTVAGGRAVVELVGDDQRVELERQGADLLVDGVIFSAA